MLRQTRDQSRNLRSASSRARALRRAFTATLFGGCLALACAGQQTGAEAPVPGAPGPGPERTEAGGEVEYQGTVPPEQRVQPPDSGESPEWHYPKIFHHELENGLRIQVVPRDTLPLVELRLVVLSGQATDGDKPGKAVVAGEMLKAGGTGKLTSQQMLDKIESLGSTLHVQTSQDTTVLSLAVTSDHFDEALEMMGDVALKPAWSVGEFRKLKRREMDRVSSNAKTNAGWAANMVLYQELYKLPTAKHPYAAQDATSKQIEKISLWDCQSWHRTHFTPKNAFLVVSGDVPAEKVNTAADKVFGKWRGNAPNKPSFTVPSTPDKLRVYLVDRPDSPQAEVRVAKLGPERTSADWPQARVANQVLGGGVAGRLFLDVREKRSLAYSTYSHIDSVANGPSPVILGAGTQTAKAGLTLQALLEHLQRISSEAPAADEMAIATRYISDVFVLQMETAAAITSLTTTLTVYGLPDDYYDKFRTEVRAVDGAKALEAGKKYFTLNGVVVVVAGDAERLSTPLSHFGDVHVIDPEKEFQEVKVVPHAPDAKIELDRIEGT